MHTYVFTLSEVQVFANYDIVLIWEPCQWTLNGETKSDWI